MASNHRPVREYINIDDSDEDEQPPIAPTTTLVAGAIPSSSSLAAAASPLTKAAQVTTELASTSISSNATASRDIMQNVNGTGALSRTEDVEKSPWIDVSSSTAMLLDPAAIVSTSDHTMEERSTDSSFQAAQPQASNSTDNGLSVPAAINDLSLRPTPGLGAPLDLTTGPFANKSLAQQPLHSTHRWEARDEDLADSSSEVKEEAQVFRSGLVYSSVMMLHAVPAYIDESSEYEHPERPERISRIFDTLKKGGCVAKMKRISIRDATMLEVMLIHQRGMWEGVERTAFFTSNSLAIQTQLLDKASSLYVNEHSARCARLSCGGVMELCDAVASGEVRNGFAIVRPPGHHAEPDRSMGFCFYNNVAVAARFIQNKYTSCRKILILDWDVHHGNGTQSAFWEDEDVLYISIHRYDDGDFFPCGPAGHQDQVGAGKGKGKNVNIPWPDKGMNDADYLAAFQRIVMPIACEFAPDFVIISAGFDAAEGDKLGECFVSPTGYARMTYDLASLANGKLVVALEGGYNLDSIARSALSVTQVLLGETPPPNIAGQAPDLLASDTIEKVEKVQSRYWKSIRQPPFDISDEEAGNLDRFGVAKLFAQHRLYHLSERYQLDALPMPLGSGEEDEDMFTGQILCSSGLFEEIFDTLVIFAHDCGNLRAEEHGLFIDRDEELGYIVDGSSKVIEWTTRNNAALIDINLNSELPTNAKAPTTSIPRRNGRNATISKSNTRLEEDKALLLYAWDNAAAMAMSTQPGMKVILIGLGTATDAVLHLIEERHVETNVAGVIQLPAYSTIPTTSKGNADKRKWYYNNSQVYLPKEHAYFTLDAQAKAGKRLGKLIRSEESRAIQVLSAEFPTIETYIRNCLK